MNDLGKILLDKLEELRIQNNGKIDIGDIDSIIFSVMDSIKGHVTSQSDIIIFNEIEKISKQIKKAKQEVVTLDPGSIGEKFIPGAASELNAVTKATEHSTNIILDAAEVIQDVAMKLDDQEASQKIIGKVTEIFEACNFQDVTGQRIAKSLKLLEDIDNTVSSLMESFSKKSKSQDNFDTQGAKEKLINKEKDLLSGPQVNAPSQSEIDDLFNKTSI